MTAKQPVFLGGILVLASQLGAAAASAEMTISGPFRHENLSVFLIHGEEQLQGKNFLTLAEALSQKKVVVHETGNVQELMIENVSDQEVYLQAGEIVKGGRQDRTLSVDAILPRRSGKVPVSSFCVESGRWAQRSGEAANQFSGSTKALSSKKLKVATRKEKNQGAVWREVEASQQALSENVRADVKSSRSATSLQLTLENGEVEKRSKAYLKALGALPGSKADVIGYAFAINGKINSAEIYGNRDLFLRLWPKLLEASAIEALSELGAKSTGEATQADVQRLLTAPAGAKKQTQDVSKRTKVVTQDAGENVLFETQDAENGGKWIHRSYY